MDPLDNTTRCPKCNEKLKGRRDVIGEVDSTVWACSPCGLYGVEGDDRLIDRKESSDDELATKLKNRAAKLIENEKALQKRYVDVPDGKAWA